MSETVDFTKFCDVHASDRYNMGVPFVKDGYEYATNTRICVRRKVDAADTPIGDKRFPNAAQLFVGSFHGVTAAYFLEVMLKTWSEVPCWCCNETGKCHCEACEGVGDTRVICECCAGSGSVYFPRTVDIGTALVDTRYDKLIRELPGIRVRIPGEGDEQKPICFVFDGGEGLLMPMLRDE